MRDDTDNAEVRMTSEVLRDARELQAGHGGAVLAALFRVLRGAARDAAGARGPLGAGQLVLH